MVSEPWLAALSCSKLLPPRTKPCKFVPVTCPLAHADKARACSPFPLFSHSPHPSLAYISPTAYPAVSHRFCKTKVCPVPLLHFSCLLSPTDTTFPCSNGTQRSRVQPWPQLLRTPNFPGPLPLGINHLSAQPPRQVPRFHMDLHQKLLSPAQGRDSFPLDQ